MPTLATWWNSKSLLEAVAHSTLSKPSFYRPMSVCVLFECCLFAWPLPVSPVNVHTTIKKLEKRLPWRWKGAGNRIYLQSSSPFQTLGDTLRLNILYISNQQKQVYLKLVPRTDILLIMYLEHKSGHAT